MHERPNVLNGFLLVTLIWSTTPLAIKWSGEGPGYVFGVIGRMLIGLGLLLIVVQLRRAPLPWHRQAIHTYIATAFGIYSTMILIY